MFGVIITGHGNFAEGMVSAVRLLAGETPRIQAVNFMPDESEDDYRAHLQRCLESMGGCQVLVLCDILGGTPSKMAYLLCREMEQVEILYGVNLPLVLEICMSVISGCEGEEGSEAMERLIEIGRQNMGNMKTLRGTCKSQSSGQKE